MKHFFPRAFCRLAIFPLGRQDLPFLPFFIDFFGWSNQACVFIQASAFFSLKCTQKSKILLKLGFVVFLKPTEKGFSFLNQENSPTCESLICISYVNSLIDLVTKRNAQRYGVFRFVFKKKGLSDNLGFSNDVYF